MTTTPPKSIAARTAVVGLTAAKIGAKQLQLLAKRPFLSSESFERRREKLDDDIAADLSQGLSLLRAGALKVAQLLSLELDVIPEAYRKEFSKSQSQVPPLNRAVVRRIVSSEFGKPPEELFQAFDMTAFAAASLGQVHRARAHTGEELAVKIQYPGIATALRTDVQLLKRVLAPFAQTKHISNLIHEVETHLVQELDYTAEQQQTAWFHQAGRIPGVAIPAPFPPYSSPVVLTTTLVDGVHLDAWLQGNPSQGHRDAVAQRLYDFLMHSVFALHRIHADPNPGNYLFRDDATIAVIDFGSVKTFTPALCEHLQNLWHAHLRSDLEGVIAFYCSLGLGEGEPARIDQRCRETLKRFGAWVSIPYQNDVFDFGDHPDFCTQGAQLFREMIMLQAMDGFTPETVLFDRTVYGLFRIFTELKARVRMHNPWIHT